MKKNNEKITKLYRDALLYRLIRKGYPIRVATILFYNIFDEDVSNENYFY